MKRTRNPFDHDIFLNLVSFLEATLPNSPNPELFKSWALTFFKCLTTRSRALPKVSGFYRLITLGIRLWYTSSLGTTSSTCILDEPSQPNSPTDAIIRPLLQSYLEHVAVAVQGGNFIDELLCTALKTVLSAPRVLVSRKVIVPAVKVALIAGKSHLNSAEEALTALEEWYMTDKSNASDNH